MAMPVLSAACPADADAIRALMASAIARSITQDDALLADTLANVNTNVDRWLAQPQQCVHLKAAAGGQIVGVVLVKDFWNLCSLFVAPEWQGRGVGRALLEAASQACAGRSPKSALFLNAAPNAVGFYERLGFVVRASKQPLPPGFRAMQRRLPAQDTS